LFQQLILFVIIKELFHDYESDMKYNSLYDE
jgi:hypothetical protein